MTKEQIARIINPAYPNVYAPTNEPTKLVFNDGSSIVGYFEWVDSSDLNSTALEKDNKFTFIKLGDDDQNYRATRDAKYITVIDGSKLKEIEYPSYSSVLMSRLIKMDGIVNDKTAINWGEFEKQWVEAIKALFGEIMYKWLSDYEELGLASFSILPVRREEPNIGKYFTAVLEIALSTGHTIIIEPIAAITSEYDGRLDFYMLGDIESRVFILRKIVNNENKWVLAKSNEPKTYHPLTKELLLKQIAEWLQ